MARIFVTTDPEGNRIELITGLREAATPFASEINNFGFQTRQGGAGHMFLLCTPGGGRERMLDFYGDLGFKLSDYIKDEVAPGVFVDAAFTHCNGRHHTLAFAEMPAPFKLHHFLVENNHMSDVGAGYDRVVEARVPLLHTLGMHPNDKMFSFYAHSPSGIAVEYGWGGLIIENDETWEVAQYDSISAWGHKNPMELGTALVGPQEPDGTRDGPRRAGQARRRTPGSRGQGGRGGRGPVTSTDTGFEIQSQDVQAGDHRLRVYTCGDPAKPAVLFLHGSGPGVSAPSNWAHLMPMFADEYYCIAPDVLGFGDSEHPDPAPAGGMPEYTSVRARSVIALLDALDVERAHF
ncbi:alpha/beta fold hydrolase, partial [Actinomadura adrarensis]